jgi:hypothetical protein
MGATGDFGVVVPAKPEHLHWVRGTCASVRHFLGDTPICVILDGDEVPEDLGSQVLVVRREDVEPPELRDLSFGSLRAKNTALWASPFDTFLLVDADAVVWGDMRVHADFERFDFVLDRGGVEPLHSVMDVELVETHFPEFDARGHAGDYVNSGAFFGRRGMLDLARYLDILRTSRRVPGMFYGSQGPLNLLVFSAVDAGEVRVDQRELQVLTGRTPREDVVRRFAVVDSEPRVVGDPVVLHWVDSPKPRVRERGRDYFEPMTFFRRRFRQMAHDGRGSAIRDQIRLRVEDAACTDWRGSNLRGRLARLRRKRRRRYLALKSAVHARAPNRVVSAARRWNRRTER